MYDKKKMALNCEKYVQTPTTLCESKCCTQNAECETRAPKATTTMEFVLARKQLLRPLTVGLLLNNFGFCLRSSDERGAAAVAGIIGLSEGCAHECAKRTPLVRCVKYKMCAIQRQQQAQKQQAFAAAVAVAAASLADRAAAFSW